MSDLDTRLRETFERVAGTTRVNQRFDDVVASRKRRLPRPVVAFAVFGAIAALFLGVLLPEVVDAADGWAVYGSVIAVVIVLVEPLVERVGALLV